MDQSTNLMKRNAGILKGFKYRVQDQELREPNKKSEREGEASTHSMVRKRCEENMAVFQLIADRPAFSNCETD